MRSMHPLQVATASQRHVTQTANTYINGCDCHTYLQGYLRAPNICTLCCSGCHTLSTRMPLNYCLTGGTFTRRSQFSENEVTSSSISTLSSLNQVASLSHFTTTLAMIFDAT